MPFLIIIPLVLAAMLLGVTYYIYLSVFHNKKRSAPTDPYAGLKSKYLEGMREVIKRGIDDLSAYPCEEITVKSHDGLTLHARLYRGDKEKPAAIMLHGYRGSSYTELSGAALLFLSHGHSVIVTDLRAHGESCGSTVTFGIKESRDCLTWVNFGKEQLGYKRFILYGISMGAASVLTASCLLRRSEVAAIIADCPFSSPRDIIMRVMKNRGLPPRALYPLVYLAALVFGRFRLNAASAVDAVKRTEIPILLIHGEDDRFVPCDMSQKIKAASASRTELFTVKGAGHGASFVTGKEEYVRAVLSFTDKYTEENEKGA